MLMPNPDKRKHNSYLKNYHSSGKAKIIGIGREVVGLRKDGATFPRSLAVSELKQGENPIFTGIVRDVTKFKQAEENLRKREAHQRLILDNVPAAISYIDKDERFVFMSQMYENLGISPENITGKKVKEALGEAAYKLAGKNIKRALAGETVEFTNKIKTKDGESTEIAVEYRPDFGPGKTVEDVFAFILNITERKKAELKIETLESRFSDAIEAISESVYLYDKSDQFVMGNSRIYEEFAEFDHLLVPGTPTEMIVQAIWDELLHTDAKMDHESGLEEIMAFHGGSADRSLPPWPGHITGWAVRRGYRVLV
jgi:PAS domain S-box-containing protein